jgi:hypothetical protein
VLTVWTPPDLHSPRPVQTLAWEIHGGAARGSPKTANFPSSSTLLRPPLSPAPRRRPCPRNHLTPDLFPPEETLQTEEVLVNGLRIRAA